MHYENVYLYFIWFCIHYNLFGSNSIKMHLYIFNCYYTFLNVILHLCLYYTIIELQFCFIPRVYGAASFLRAERLPSTKRVL